MVRESGMFRGHHRSLVHWPLVQGGRVRAVFESVFYFAINTVGWTPSPDEVVRHVGLIFGEGRLWNGTSSQDTIGALYSGLAN